MTTSFMSRPMAKCVALAVTGLIGITTAAAAAGTLPATMQMISNHPAHAAVSGATSANVGLAGGSATAAATTTAPAAGSAAVSANVTTQTPSVAGTVGGAIGAGSGLAKVAAAAVPGHLVAPVVGAVVPSGALPLPPCITNLVGSVGGGSVAPLLACVQSVLGNLPAGATQCVSAALATPTALNNIPSCLSSVLIMSSISDLPGVNSAGLGAILAKITTCINSLPSSLNGVTSGGAGNLINGITSCVSSNLQSVLSAVGEHGPGHTGGGASSDDHGHNDD